LVVVVYSLSLYLVSFSVVWISRLAKVSSKKKILFSISFFVFLIERRAQSFHQVET
jgi:hypothetical protein